jgi:tRNA G18 (ribose-2'-O)-methylase SpoU
MLPTKFNTQDSTTIPAYPRNPIHLVLDNIRSAFNVGSAFRIGDSVCVEKIHLCGISSAPNEKVEKTALGSTQSVPWQYYSTSKESIHELRSQNIPICIVELTSRSVNFWDFCFPKPTALVFGHELYGVGEELFPLADAFISIPMYGKKTTLNVSTSIGVVLFEVLRQWKFQVNQTT